MMVEERWLSHMYLRKKHDFWTHIEADMKKIRQSHHPQMVV